MTASQLCTMFLSLHVVFLCAVAMVESSSGNEQGEKNNLKFSIHLYFVNFYFLQIFI